MTNFFKAFLLAAICLLALQNPVEAGRQDFQLVNYTGQTIYRVYCSSIYSDNWEEDLLGDDTLSDGQSLNIRFNDSEDNQYWDLRVVFPDGSDLDWRNIDLFSIRRVTIYSDGSANFE